MRFLYPLYHLYHRYFRNHRNYNDDPPPPPSISPLEALQSSLNFVHEWSIFFNVDESHNTEHSKEALFWFLEIMKQQHLSTDPFDSTTLLIAMHGIILHDVLDKKYMKDNSQLQSYSILLENHLRSVLPVEEDVTLLMRVMDSISYSKTVTEDGVQFPEWIPETGKWWDIYHWVRESDLLASYNLTRMIHFRFREIPVDQYEDPDTWSVVVTDVLALYHKRIATLLEKGLFLHPEALEIAKHLHYISSLKIQQLSPSVIVPEPEWTFFTMVHKVSWSSMLEPSIIRLLQTSK